MEIYAGLHLDQMSAEQGATTQQWFSCNMSRSFSRMHDAGIPWFASVLAGENGPARRFEGDANRAAFLHELHQSTYSAQLLFFSDEQEHGRLSSLPAGVEPAYRTLSSSTECDEADLADPLFCSSLVDTLVESSSMANPTFGRIEHGQFSERSNLDIALRRKPKTFLPESRLFLRGYAWVTVCPEELLVRLGGPAALQDSAAFFRVIRLAGGGAVLQATETLSGYSDPAMRRAFKAIARVLPPGLPRPHAAFPGVRFVTEDSVAV